MVGHADEVDDAAAGRADLVHQALKFILQPIGDDLVLDQSLGGLREALLDLAHAQHAATWDGAAIHHDLGGEGMALRTAAPAEGRLVAGRLQERLERLRELDL